MESCHGYFVAIIAGPHSETEADLLQVVDASNALGRALTRGQGGQEQAGQDGDDGNHNQQLNQRER